MAARRSESSGRRRAPRRRRLRPAAVAVWAVLGVLVGVGLVRHAGVRPPANPHLAVRALTLPSPAAAPAVSARAAAVYAAGVWLMRHHAYRPWPIASTAKIMTAYLAALRLGPSDTVTVTPADVRLTAQQAAEGGVEAPVTAGERLTAGELMTALLLPSANNAASLLAQRVAGRQGAFVAEMNRTARRLGMSGAHYADPSGLSPRTRASAADLVRVTVAALALPEVARTVRTERAWFPGWGRVTNLNRLLGSDPGVIGVKTGYTSAAGHCLVVAARRRGKLVVAVVLGEPSWARAFADGRRLVAFAARALRPHTVLAAGSVVGAVGAPGARRPLVLARPLAVAAAGLGPGRLRLQGRFRDLVAPRPGEAAGEVWAVSGGRRVGAAPVRVAAGAVQ